MAVKLVSAVSRPTPHDRPIWTMQKGRRCAVAVERVYREIRDGRELRISVDGDLRWSQLYRGPSLEASADDKRRALEARGWLDDTKLV